MRSYSDEVFNYGFNEGYDNGFADGHSVGFEDGYEKAKEEFYNHNFVTNYEIKPYTYNMGGWHDR